MTLRRERSGTRIPPIAILVPLLLVLIPGVAGTFYYDDISALGYNVSASNFFVGSTSLNNLITTSSSGSGSTPLFIGNEQIATLSDLTSSGSGGWTNNSENTSTDLNANINGGSQLRLFTSGGSNRGTFYAQDASPHLIIQTSGGEDIRIGDNEPDIFIEGSNDFIGIGTTNPDAKLHSVGNIFIEDGSGEIIYETTSASHYNWRTAVQEQTTGAYEIHVGDADANATDDTWTQVWRIDNSGNVQQDGNLNVDGTGTSTIAGALQLGGTGASVNEFSTDGTLSGDSDTAVPTEQAVRTFVETQVAGSSNGGGWTNTSTLISSNVGDNVTIDSGVLFVDATNNFVGINTATPGSALEIVGGIEQSSDNGVEFYVVSTRRSGAGNTVADIYAASDDGLVLGSGGSDTTLFISSDERVGIGTINPTSQLEIAGGDVFVNNGDIYLNTSLGAKTLFVENNCGGGFCINNPVGATAFQIVDGRTYVANSQLTPQTDNSQSLGDASYRWNNIQVGTGTSIFDGDIGIGLTNPSQPLEVNGSIAVQTSDAIYFDGGSNTYIQNNGGANLLLVTNGVSALSLESDQDVRLPNGELDVDGTGTSTIAGALQLGGTGASVNEFSTDGTLSGDSDTAVPTEQAVRTFVETQVAGSSNGGGWTNTSTLISSNVGDNITMDAGVLFVDATNDRVGIGTTSPDNDLDILDTSGDATIRVTTGGGNDAILALNAPAASGAQSRILFGDDSDDDVGRIEYTHNSGGEDFFTVTVNASERLRINGQGNIGLGTTTPAETLEVVGDVQIGDSIGAGTGFKLGQGVYPFNGYWYYEDDGTGYGPAWIHNNSASGNTYPTMWLSTDGDGALLRVDSDIALGDMTMTNLGAYPAQTISTYIRGSSGADSYINNGGNFGIGTANPTVDLDVVGNGNTIRTTSTTDTNANYFLFRTNESTGQGLVGTEGSGAGTLISGTTAYSTVIASTASGTDLQLGSAGSVRMTIDQDGDVGIGTSSPRTTLDIDGTIFAGNATSTTGSVIIAGDYGGANDDFINVLGGMYSTGGTFLGYATKPKAGSSGYVSAADNVAWARGGINIDSGGFHVVLGPAQSATVGNDVSVTEYFTVENTGDVGINNTNPSYQLDIVGNQRIQSGSLGIGVAPSSTNGRLNTAGHIIAGDDVYASGDRFVFGSTTADGEYLTRSGNDIIITAGGADNLRVDGDNGVSLDIGNSDIDGITITDSGIAYPEINCVGSGGPTYCEFNNGIYVIAGNIIGEAPILARGGIQDDSGDLVLNDNVDINGIIYLGGNDLDFQSGDTGQIRSVGGISFDWTAGTYDSEAHHGIQSRDEAGTLADDLRINSYSSTVLTIDSNANDGNSEFVLQKESTGDGADLLRIDENGDADLTGDLEVSGNDISDSGSTNRITFSAGNIILTVG